MVQVLPYIPGIGEQVAPYVNQAINDLGGAFQQRNVNKKDDAIMSQINDPNTTWLQKISAISRLSGEKGKTIAPLYQTLMKQEGVGQQVNSKTDTLLNSINQMRNITEEGYTGGQFGLKTIGGPLRREAVEKKNEFDTYAITLEGYLRDLTTKGTLSKAVFNELLNRLPNSKLSDRENLGRLKAIEDVIRQHSGKPGSTSPHKSVEKEVKTLKKVAPGTKLPQDEAQTIFNQAGGDPEKARKIAKQLGYEWQ